MHWADRYIRIPFVDGGRDASGLDCFGLVRMVLKEHKGIDLPAYGEISAQDLAAIARTMNAGAEEEIWLDADKPQPFDVAVMKWFARPSAGAGHVGIVIDGNRILHTEGHSGPVIADIGHFSIKRRILFYRRHRSLAHEFA